MFNVYIIAFLAMSQNSKRYVWINIRNEVEFSQFCLQILCTAVSESNVNCTKETLFIFIPETAVHRSCKQT